jgi:hypothetical protein
MNGLVAEIIPDSEQGGFTARVPDTADTEEQRLPIVEKRSPCI